MGILIQKKSGQETFVAYAKGKEITEIRVYFDGDDFSLFDKEQKRFLKDEHGYPFFGLDKAEEIVSEFVSNRESISA